MVEIIVVIIIIYLLFQLVKFLITKVIIPFAAGAAKITVILGAITAVIAVGMAFIFSLVNYFRAIRQNRNAYDGYVDSSPKKPDAETRRGYFFGPGYHQIGAIVKGTWSNHGKTFAAVKQWAWIPILGWIFFIFFCVAQGVFGSIFTVIFSVLHFIVIFTFMCVFYVLFSILWVFDRIVLLSKAVASRCPQCKHISVLPAFICPSCGRHHRNLVPGPYGVFARRCSCGRSLPTTFFTGRSKLEARCPRCECDLASGSATQFGVQLIGGSSAGKTVFLTSFLHLYLKKIKTRKGVRIKTHPQEDFNKLEQLFQEGRSESTNDLNAKMYSIVHTKGRFGGPHEFALYDVAGEVFAGQSTDSEQRQYGYCEGIVLVVDPFSAQNVRQAYAALHQGKEPANFSKTDVNDVVVGFINEYTRIGSLKVGQKSNIPVSVVIAKADVDVVQNEIGPQRIADACQKNPQLYPAEKDARDALCCDYLRAVGMNNMVNNLTAQFKQIHYFPVSAMGHEQGNSEGYDPWGVLDAVLWIVMERDQALAEIWGKKGAIIRKIGRRLAVAAMTTAMITAMVLAGYFFISQIKSKAPVWFDSVTHTISFLNGQPAAEPAGIAETIEASVVTATVISSALNVRDAPMGNIIRTVRKGTVLTLTGPVKNGWAPVEIDGQAAFVSADLVQIRTIESIKAGLYDGGTFIKELQDLNDARKWLAKNAQDGGSYTIVLGKDQESKKIVFDYGGKGVRVTLKASSEEKTVTFAAPSFPVLSYLSSLIPSIDATDSLFTVKPGVTFVLEDGVTISGLGAEEKARNLVRIDGGTFVMNGGAITGNRTSTSGGGVYVGQGGTFTMNNGIISGNTSTLANDDSDYGGGAGVYINNGDFTMAGGVISKNAASWYGGGVNVASGSFTMTGGTISGNTASRAGGGVYVNNNAGVFTMTGGIISGNTARENGGGINVNNFTMTDGIISDNTSSADGGGIHVRHNFTMNGGTISGNTSNEDGGGVNVGNIFTMNGGTISGNTAAESGGGCFTFTFVMSGGTIGGNTSGTVNRANRTRDGGGVSVHGGVLTKSGGIIYGFDVPKGQANQAPSNALGHAVFVKDVGVRNATAWKSTILDSQKKGIAGGWRN